MIRRSEQTYRSYGQGKTRAIPKLIRNLQSELQARKAEIASRFCDKQEATSSIRAANVVPGIVSMLIQAKTTERESESSHATRFVELVTTRDDNTIVDDRIHYATNRHQ